MNDPIVNEVRRVREAHAAQFHLDAIFKDLKEQEKRSDRNFVSFDAHGNEPASSAKKHKEKGKRKKQAKS
jgi:hypothetical protein